MDLKTNDAIEGGYSKCHGGRDLQITATGDIATTEDGYTNLIQRLAIWILSPKGELTDPRAGCSYYVYRHAKMTRENMRFLGNDLKSDLEYSFPEWAIDDVKCYPSYDLDGHIARNQVICVITLPEETIELMLQSNIIEDVWLGAKNFLRYGELPYGNLEGRN